MVLHLHLCVLLTCNSLNHATRWHVAPIKMFAHGAVLLTVHGLLDCWVAQALELRRPCVVLLGPEETDPEAWATEWAQKEQFWKKSSAGIWCYAFCHALFRDWSQGTMSSSACGAGGREVEGKRQVLTSTRDNGLNRKRLNLRPGYSRRRKKRCVIGYFWETLCVLQVLVAAREAASQSLVPSEFVDLEPGEGVLLEGFDFIWLWVNKQGQMDHHFSSFPILPIRRCVGTLLTLPYKERNMAWGGSLHPSLWGYDVEPGDSSDEEGGGQEGWRLLTSLVSWSFACM